MSAYSPNSPGTTAVFKPPIIARRAPLGSDTGYELGQSWVDELTNSSWQLTSIDLGSAVWTALGGGTVSISQLSADMGLGGVALPVDGNINLNGSVNELEVIASGENIGVRFVDNIIYNGGNFTIQSASIGSSRFLRVINTSDTASSSANIKVQVPSSTADGGAYYSSTSLAGSTWSFGIDSNTNNWALAEGEGVVSNQAIQVVPSSSINFFRNLVMQGSGTDGLIAMKGGAETDFIGSAVLVGGTVTVANTNIGASDRILVIRSTTGGTEGHLSYTISGLTSFTINSSSATDTSTVVYVIFRQT